MPLQTNLLKQRIRTLLDESWDNTTSSEEARAHFSNRLGDIIDSFVRSGTVTVTVTTTGSSTNQAGGGTGNIT